MRSGHPRLAEVSPVLPLRQFQSFFKEDLFTELLHVFIALIVPGCVHVCLRFAAGVGFFWCMHVSCFDCGVHFCFEL